MNPATHSQQLQNLVDMQAKFARPILSVGI